MSEGAPAEVDAVVAAIAAELATLPTIGTSPAENAEAVLEAARMLGIPAVSTRVEEDGIVLVLDHPLRYVYGTGRII